MALFRCASGGSASFSYESLSGTKVSDGVLTYDISSINPEGSKVLFEDIFPVVQHVIVHTTDGYNELVASCTWAQSADGKTLTLTLTGNAPSLIYATRGWPTMFYYR